MRLRMKEVSNMKTTLQLEAMNLQELSAVELQDADGGRVRDILIALLKMILGTFT